MGLRCLLGHAVVGEIFNRGLLFGSCRRCRRAVIRSRGGPWHQLPRGYRVAWCRQGAHAVNPWTVVLRARQEEPRLHKLGRQLRGAPDL